VRSVLALHRKVSGSKTEVDIRDGVITLRGAATSEAQQDLATEYAEDVKGVLRVTNVMTVLSSQRSSMEFQTVAKTAKSVHALLVLANGFSLSCESWVGWVNIGRGPTAASADGGVILPRPWPSVVVGAVE
jgi:BON domain